MPIIKFGIITDTHVLDCVDGYNPTQKVRDAVAVFNDSNLNFCVHCGDVSSDKLGQYSEQAQITAIENIVAEYNKFDGDVYYTLGNWECTNIDAQVSQDAIGLESRYYSFTIEPIHFIVLNTGEYGAWDNQKVWLTQELLDNKEKPCIIFTHYHIQSEASWRDVVESQKNVYFLFHGHTKGQTKTVNNVQYINVEAMNHENMVWPHNAYMIVEIDTDDNTVNITGYGLETNYSFNWPDGLDGWCEEEPKPKPKATCQKAFYTSVSFKSNHKSSRNTSSKSSFKRYIKNTFPKRRKK